MTLTARDIAWMGFLRRYYYARTSQISEAYFPADADGSVTRSRVRLAEREGYVRRNHSQVTDPLDPRTQSPIWALTLKGATALARATGDASLVLRAEPSFRDWLSLNHFASLTSLHWMIDRAIAAQTHVVLHGLCFEHEVADASASDPDKRYRLYTRTSEKVVCVPDSGIMIQAGCLPGRVIYMEREMGSDLPTRVAAKKHKGYAELAAHGLHRRHFPEAADFRVLCLAPSASWRDAIRDAMRDKPGADYWLFVASPDLTADTVLHSPIVHRCGHAGPVPLVPPPAAPPAPSGGCGEGGRAAGRCREAVTA